MADEAQALPNESVSKAGCASHSYLNHDRPFQSVLGDYGLHKQYRGFSIQQDQETEMLGL